MSLDDLKTLKVSLSEQWEKACKNCGKCCFDKRVSKSGGSYIDYNSPCEFLKFEGSKSVCTVYADRFSKCGVCNTIPSALDKGYLPADCAYVMHKATYRAPKDDNSWYKSARKKLQAKYDNDETTVLAVAPEQTSSMPPKLNVEEKDGEGKYRRGWGSATMDPREKCKYNIKPSGHGGGG